MNLPHSSIGISGHGVRSIQHIDNDIDDELDFHIQCRIEDLLAEGMSKQQAENAARSAFGSQASIRRKCQQINYGYRLWMSRISICGLLLATATIVWLSMQLVSARDHNRTLTSELYQAQAQYSDVSGTVCDTLGKPLADVDVLIVVKTWPHEIFTQAAFDTKTDSTGQFHYPVQIPNNQPYEVQLTAIAQGYAFESTSVSKLDGTRKPLDEIDFQLEKALSLTIILKNEDGSPIQDALIYPNCRSHDEGEEFIHAIGAGSVTQITGESGAVQLDCFGQDDMARIVFRKRYEDWQTRDVLISKGTDQIEIVAHELKNTY